MINAKEAYDIFKKAYPKLVPTECCLYDNKYYIFTAPEEVGKVDFNDPYYAVNRATRRLSRFTPVEDLDKWLDALVNHQVNWR